MSHKLRRLNEQFHQFRAMTQTRLDTLALSQNRTSSKSLESHIQALNDHYHHMSQDLEHLRHSAAQEIQDLRHWTRKLEKRNKRMEGRLALMETKCLHFQKPKYDPGQDFFNFTVELQSQEEMLSALQVQRDELLVGLHGLQESLKNQALRVTRLEGQISEVLQWSGRWKIRGSGMTGVSSKMTSQKFTEHCGRNQTHKGGRLWRRRCQPNPN
ncbi:pentraxin-4 [Cololabis saira]|uniref:pentraxin-4 n=1 Tax=Cololabis saira TaxID=129043 RepID=UPI002AD5A8EE|nr:pentraxin-4 [Cololabis saira]